MNARVWFVASLLLLSGMCALIYQVAWLREFRLIFGGSTMASAAVLAIFMGGLGFGNLILGRFVDRHAQPLKLYAWLEIGIALACAVSPFLIDLARLSYASLGGQEALGASGATAVRLLLATLVIGLPTLLMGGTLPAAAKAVTTANDVQRRGLSLVYGLNTLGAVLGTLASTFWMLQAFGTRSTLWLACLVNLLLAALAWKFADAPGMMDITRKQRKRQRGEDVAEQPIEAPAYPIAAPWIYGSALLVGCVFLLMELVWYRMLGPILGGTAYTFGLILAIALTGIGVGGILYGVLFRNRRPTAISFALTCALQALAMGIPFALGDRLALWANYLHQHNGASFSAAVVNWTLITAIVVLPSALLSGLQFPVLIALLGKGEEHIAKQVGAAFAWNTIGCITGSLLGGFGLLPLMTAPGVWCLAVITLSLLALVWAALAYPQKSQRLMLVAPVVASALALCTVWAIGPTAVWRHSGIGAGRGATDLSSANERQRWINQQRQRVVWEAEGVESSVGVVVDDSSFAFYVNGKSDGSALGDAGTQIMLGMVGGTLHPAPQRALVVGLGTGETAGWLASIPEMQQVDVVELEPSVVTMAELCKPVNQSALENPKVRLIFNDAREVLTTTSHKYDLIVSEPSNPYRAGVASLFTREFYRSAQQRLNEQGLFCQWLQAYEIDEQTVGLVLATLKSVFPHVEVWETGHGDLLLMGAEKAIAYDVARLRARLQQEPFRSAIDCSWRAVDLEGLLSGYIGGNQLAEKLAAASPGAVNTDDCNLLEFAFARSLGKARDFDLLQLRRRAAELGDHRPPLVHGEVDWKAAVDQYLLRFVFRRLRIPDIAGLDSAQQSRVLALNASLAGDHKQALEHWRRQSRDPQYSTELAVMITSALKQGDLKSYEWTEELRKTQPLEANGLMALALLSAGDRQEAADMVEQTLQDLKHNPWPRYAVHLLQFAAVLSQDDPVTAQRMYDNVKDPFCAGILESERQVGALALAELVGTKCLVAQLESFEPNPIWSEKFLRVRAEQYTAANHPLSGRARRQLAEYLQAEN